MNMKKKLKPNLFAPHLLALSFVLPSTSFAITMEEAVTDAIVHNPQFRENVKLFRTIEAENEASNAGYYPKIDLSIGLGYEAVETSQGFSNTYTKGLLRRESSIRITQNLFNGFGDQKEIERQAYRLDAQAYKTEASANDIAIDMIEAYLNFIKHQELLTLSSENLNTHERILNQVTTRLTAGIGNQVELDQVNARLALARSNFASAQNEFHNAKARFRRALGRDSDNILVRPEFTYELPQDINAAINLALVDHPTLRSASSDIASQRSEFEASDKTFYPQVDLDLEKTFDSGVSGFERPSQSYQVMVRMKYNLYNGGRDQANQARTASRYHQATEVRNNTRRQIIENLQYAWNGNRFTSEQLVYINQHIKLTLDTLNGYRKQFTLGRRSLLDLLNTENEYTSALKTLINTESDALVAKYRILATTGHLLPYLNINYKFVAAEADHNDE